MKRDDVLVIYKLDRLCRNLKHLLNTLYDFNKQGFHIKSISEPYIDSQNNTEYFSFVDTFYKYEFLLTKERLNSKFETKKVKKLKIDSLTYKEVLEAVKNNYPKKTIQSMFNISSSQLTNIIRAQAEKTAIII
jgi:DNA invertase Pin-like site-specific DNA recombinase